MADETLNIQIKVNAETGQLELVGRGLENVGNKAEGLGSSFKGISVGATQLLSSLGLVASSGAVLAFFVSASKEAEEFSESMRRVQFSLKVVGEEASASREELAKWAQKIQETTRYSDNEALDALSKLVRVTGDLAQAQLASEVAMGISSVTTMDLTESQRLLTDLINGNEMAVRAVRREFRDLVGDTKNTQEILNILTEKFGKLAESEDTLTSSTGKLKNAFNDLKKEVGESLNPTLKEVTEFSTKVITNITETVSILSKAFKGVSKIDLILNPASIVAEYKTILKNLEDARRKFDENEKKDDKKKVADKILSKKQESAEEKTAREKREKEAKEAKVKEEKEIQERLEYISKDAQAKTKIYQDLQKEQEDIEKVVTKDLKEEEDKRLQKIKEANAEKLASAQAVSRTIASEFGGAFQQIITESKTADEAFTQVFRNMINMIIQTIAQMLILKVLTGSVTGGGAGGLIGALGLFGKAGGGEVKAGHSYIVGENGAEVLKMGASGGEVIPNNRLKEVLPAGSRGAPEAQGMTVNVNVNLSTESLSIDNSKAIIQALAQEIGNKTADAVRLSVQMKNLSGKNSAKAV